LREAPTLAERASEGLSPPKRGARRRKRNRMGVTASTLSHQLRSALGAAGRRPAVAALAHSRLAGEGEDASNLVPATPCARALPRHGTKAFASKQKEAGARQRRRENDNMAPNKLSHPLYFWQARCKVAVLRATKHTLREASYDQSTPNICFSRADGFCSLIISSSSVRCQNHTPRVPDRF